MCNQSSSRFSKIYGTYVHGTFTTLCSSVESECIIVIILLYKIQDLSSIKPATKTEAKMSPQAARTM